MSASGQCLRQSRRNSSSAWFLKVRMRILIFCVRGVLASKALKSGNWSWPGSWAWTQKWHQKKDPLQKPNFHQSESFLGGWTVVPWRGHISNEVVNSIWNALHLDWITVTLLGGPSQEIHVHRRVRVLILIQPALWTLFDDTITISECGPIHLNRRGEMVKGMVCNQINNINNHDSSC